MKLQIECTYCGFKWFRNILISSTGAMKFTCIKCKDSNTIVRDLARDSIDYYQGAPAFEEENDDQQEPDGNDFSDDDYWTG